MKEWRSHPCGRHQHLRALPHETTGTSFGHRLLDKYLDYLLSAGLTQRQQLHSWRRCEGLRRETDARPAASAAPPTSASARTSQALLIVLAGRGEGETAGPGPWAESPGPPAHLAGDPWPALFHGDSQGPCLAVACVCGELPARHCI